MVFVFFRTKKNLETKHVFFVFENRKQFKKHESNKPINETEQESVFIFSLMCD